MTGAGTTGLLDRVVAVTGAGRGLGLQIVRELLAQGAQVVANYRSWSEDLEQVRKEAAGRVHLVRGDIGEEAGAVALAQRARELGGLDALVCNAAVTRDRLLVHMPVEDWDEVQRVSLRGAFLCTKHAVKIMIRQRHGRIIYISSVVARMGNAGQANYAAAKAGLQGLAYSVAQEYGSYNIRTVVVSPGLLDAGLSAGLSPAIRRRVTDRSLAGVGSVDEVAATVAFLTGPGATFVNATTVHIDGGARYP